MLEMVVKVWFALQIDPAPPIVLPIRVASVSTQNLEPEADHVRCFSR